MFWGTFNKPNGLTAKELLNYLEHVVAHGDGDNVVYASGKPVTKISCTLDSVQMEVGNGFGFNEYTNEPFAVDPVTCKHSWRLMKIVPHPALMKDRYYYMCDICKLVKYEVKDDD